MGLDLEEAAEPAVDTSEPAETARTETGAMAELISDFKEDLNVAEKAVTQVRVLVHLSKHFSILYHQICKRFNK